ncbi:serine protease inhibitor swm-1-like [Toxorhynchites rutilus septentrionalis]|uniref:serine protease inhibitor swm-1-like n=1 Tax=Toxorhynchites rutilus septentrionalis TaxID=329112 RepID=UPI00247ACE28|nr:serine protease inhibitor swm-1-like [Toxorhynchites rutilus septentrionalis]
MKQVVLYICVGSLLILMGCSFAHGDTPLLSCPTNEVYTVLKTLCEPTCFTNCTNVRASSTRLYPACVCPPGQVRHSKVCIPKIKCPVAQTLSPPVLTSLLAAPPCPANSRYNMCTPCCQPTCTNDCSTIRCIAACTGSPTCVCNEGFVKLGQNCVPRSACPKATRGS